MRHQLSAWDERQLAASMILSDNRVTVSNDVRCMDTPLRDCIIREEGAVVGFLCRDVANNMRLLAQYEVPRISENVYQRVCQLSAMRDTPHVGDHISFDTFSSILQRNWLYRYNTFGEMYNIIYI